MNKIENNFTEAKAYSFAENLLTPVLIIIIGIICIILGFIYSKYFILLLVISICCIFAGGFLCWANLRITEAEWKTIDGIIDNDNKDENIKKTKIE
jgi:c-di-AMP phosphodiesterase-like protein